MKKTIGQYLDNRADFFNWMNGSIYSIIALVAVIDSGMLDEIGEEPVSTRDLAARAGIPEDQMRRLVNFLVAHEIVALVGEGQVVATARVDALREGACYARCVAFGTAPAGPMLFEALREGVSAFEKYHGKPVFEYFRDHPADAATFAEFMSYQIERFLRFLHANHEFRPFRLVADIGGSEGGMLLSLLEHYPDASGILFDLPHVISRVANTVSASPGGERVELVGGSFFESVPAADLYLLRQVLHDWSDEECVRILASIAAAMEPGGRVAVIEHVLPETPAPTEGLATDIAMMVWANGRERMLSEFETLFGRAGFSLDRMTANPDGQSVMEAVLA
jgi:hypothetical protein